MGSGNSFESFSVNIHKQTDLFDFLCLSLEMTSQIRRSAAFSQLIYLEIRCSIVSIENMSQD